MSVKALERKMDNLEALAHGPARVAIFLNVAAGDDPHVAQVADQLLRRLSGEPMADFKERTMAEAMAAARVGTAALVTFVREPE